MSAEIPAHAFFGRHHEEVLVGMTPRRLVVVGLRAEARFIRHDRPHPASRWRGAWRASPPRPCAAPGAPAPLPPPKPRPPSIGAKMLTPARLHDVEVGEVDVDAAQRSHARHHARMEMAGHHFVAGKRLVAIVAREGQRRFRSWQRPVGTDDRKTPASAATCPAARCGARSSAARPPARGRQTRDPPPLRRGGHRTQMSCRHPYDRSCIRGCIRSRAQ